MFHLQLAGYSFTIENQFDYVKKLCRDYSTNEPGERISICQKDILREQAEGIPYPSAYLESLAVYRKICERLLCRDIILFHCSALAFHQQAYLFAAPSGAGKSTHTRLWRETFGDEVRMINDDKPLLHIDSDTITVYGTPFAGKEGLQTNTSAPVAGIVMLHQAAENSIQKLSLEQAYPLLLRQTYHPKDTVGLSKTLELVHRLAELPVFSLGCTISTQAVQMAHRALTEHSQDTVNC